MSQSGLLELNRNDYVKGIVAAIFSGFMMSVLAIVGAVGFDLFTADWKKILAIGVAGAVSSLYGYLQKNSLTDKQGTIAGVITMK